MTNGATNGSAVTTGHQNKWTTAIAAYDFMSVALPEHDVTTTWRHEIGEVSWKLT